MIIMDEVAKNLVTIITINLKRLFLLAIIGPKRWSTLSESISGFFIFCKLALS